jgi:putative phosphotransacetylase
MNEKTLRTLVERIVLTELAKSGELIAPVNSSNRHIHLSQKDLEQLFGAGYTLKKMRDLAQPGQYACEERVTLETPKGKLALRVVGPIRKETQIELSFTEMIKLGITPVVRMSGDSTGTPGGVISNGDRRVTLERGIMVAARHLHMSAEQAKVYGLNNGDIVSLHAQGIRDTVFNNVIVRCGDGHELEAHIDKDEANAAALTDGALCRIVKQAQLKKAVQSAPDTVSARIMPAKVKKERRLITEDDVKAAHAAGCTSVPHDENDIITPLAKDAAWELGIEL